ncbi:MAG: 6-bladed beta-propeller [Terriglobales bacterium]
MVQCFLSDARRGKLRSATGVVFVALLLLAPASAKRQKAETGAQEYWPELLLDGGRKLSYERTLTSEHDIRGKRSFWTKLVDAIAGEPIYKQMVRPYDVVVDSRGRIIVTDPGLAGVHVFDLAQHKYKFLERQARLTDSMLEPQCVTVDAHDNILVTDSRVGKVFVFEPSGNFRGMLGSLKGGEGLFKRATGIAVDPQTQNIYVTDTLRDRIYVLDSKGQVLGTIGQHGDGDGEFNYPTELLIRNGMLAVVDAMNFRVQLFDMNGSFQAAIGQEGDRAGGFFRPKGIGLDSENHIYVVDGEFGVVQVFDRQGQLLYYFGNGSGFGEFQLPAGLFVDQNDRVYVVDSFNRRLQVFQYHALKTRAQERQ